MAYVGVTLIFILIISSVMSITMATTNVAFLKGVPRLNDSSYQDYYFSCNALGDTIQWEVNGIVLGIFLGGAVAKVFSGTTSNFIYTATLLSSQKTTKTQYTFDSLLIVSVQVSHCLNVTCSHSGLMKSSIVVESVDQLEIADEDRKSNNKVLFERILTNVIVNGNPEETPTSIFICGVNSIHMDWITNISNYGFSILDTIGHDHKNLDFTDITVSQQAILIDTEPFMLVTVFVATGNYDVSVTCGYFQNYLTLISNYFSDSRTSISEPTAITEATFKGSRNSTSSMIATTNGKKSSTEMPHIHSSSAHNTGKNLLVIILIIIRYGFMVYREV